MKWFEEVGKILIQIEHDSDWIEEDDDSYAKYKNEIELSEEATEISDINVSRSNRKQYYGKRMFHGQLNEVS